MNTIKNCYSPSGMGYSLQGTRLVNLPDCPVCKYGTIGQVFEKWYCADCGEEVVIGPNGRPQPLLKPGSAAMPSAAQVSAWAARFSKGAR